MILYLQGVILTFGRQGQPGACFAKVHVLMEQIKSESQLMDALVNAVVSQPWSCRGICDLL